MTIRPRRPRPTRFATALLLAGLASSTVAALDEATLRDMAGVLATDALVQAGAEHCDEQHAPVAPRLRAAVDAWRAKHDTEGVQRRLDAAAPGALDKLRGNAAAMRERMAREGSAEAVCAQLLASLASPAMDLRARHPAAYAAAPATTPASTGDASTGPAPSGTVLTPAQIAALVERGRQGKDPRDWLQAAGIAGRLYIRGTVVQRGEHQYIETVKGAFRSRLSVAPGNSLAAHVGREVVVSGVIEEWPISVIFLKSTRLVADPSALKNATVPEEAGLLRAPVEPQAVRAAPGRGLADGAVQGIHYRNQFIGTELREETLLLLKDGTAYDRTELAPEELDVARSRELEPQRWLRWKGSGGTIRVQRQDDHGQPKGDWEERSGVMYGPWPAGQLLNTAFTAKAFHGNLTTGGVYSSDTLRFRGDGRFESSRYAQGGSGVLAGLNGFSSSATSLSDKTGTRSSAGATNSGGAAGTGSVTVTSSSRRDDGNERRGSYRVGGYTLELRYDSGRVERLFSYPMGADSMLVGSTRYRREGAK